jgi:hypothetical protein
MALAVKGRVSPRSGERVGGGGGGSGRRNKQLVWSPPILSGKPKSYTVDEDMDGFVDDGDDADDDDNDYNDDSDDGKDHGNPMGARGILKSVVLVVVTLAVLVAIIRYDKARQLIHYAERVNSLPAPSKDIILNEVTTRRKEVIGLSQSLPRPRLLFMIASNSMSQFLYLQKALDCMRDHCNAGWNVTVHISASGEFTTDHPRFQELQDRAFCVDSNSYVNIVLEHYKDIGFGLNSKHRIYMREHLDEFDYFSYAEEDMLLTVSHLRAVTAAETILRRDLPETWMNYAVGFLRYVFYLKVLNR